MYKNVLKVWKTKKMREKDRQFAQLLLVKNKAMFREYSKCTKTGWKILYKIYKNANDFLCMYNKNVFLYCNWVFYVLWYEL